MRQAPLTRWSRRKAMLLVVGAQIAVLAGFVAVQEANRIYDPGPPVDLEISGARAWRDPFRGASIGGHPAVTLEEPKATMPPERLRPGERVLVFFAREREGPSRIAAVERRGIRADPLFGADSFSIPGTVLREDGATPFFRADGRGAIARVGTPPVSVALDLPSAIPVDDAALSRLAGPSIVRVDLRRGALGHRHFADVRLSGEAWSPQTSFAYDERGDRLVVFAPRQDGPEDRRPLSAGTPPRTSVFFFDGMGNERGSMEISGRVLEGSVEPAGATLLVLLSQEPWGYGPVTLARIGEDGAVLRHGPPIVYDRVVGVDGEDGGLWVLSGIPTTPPQPPFSIERMTLGGPQGPKLGPFASRPRLALTHGQTVWVLEPDQHRITRLDRAGRVERQYGDMNRPTDLAVDAGSFVVVEASQTQLTKFTLDGRALWRIPRFQGLAWVLPETGTGGGWVGASSFDGRKGGVFRYAPDGGISRLSEAVTVRATGDWNRSRLGADAVQAAGRGRLFLREPLAIVILQPDGALLKRLDGFRYPAPRPLRG